MRFRFPVHEMEMETEHVGLMGVADDTSFVRQHGAESAPCKL